MTEFKDFARLNDWKSLSDSDLRQEFSQDAAAALKRLLQELGSEADRSVEVLPDNFVKLVREVWHLKQSGARALGDALVDASKYAEAGLQDEARAVYLEYLETCNAQFYRQIALEQIASLSKS